MKTPLPLSEQEAVHILVCLRIFQHARRKGAVFELPLLNEEIGMITSFPPLSDGEINALCERIGEME